MLSLAVKCDLFDWCSSFKSLVRAANEEEEKAREATMAQAEKEELAKQKAAAEAEAAAAAEKEKEAAAASAAAKLSAMDLADKESAGIDKVSFSRTDVRRACRQQ